MVQVWTGAWSPTAKQYGGGAQSTSAIGLPYLYTGQRQDYETRVHYYKNRYFDPVMGRFLSRDPLGLSAGPSLYEYAASLPMQRFDPLGLLSDSERAERYGGVSSIVGDVFRPRTSREYGNTSVTGISAAYSSQSAYGAALAKRAADDPGSLTDEERRALAKLAAAGAVSPLSTLAIRVRFAHTTERVYYNSAGSVSGPAQVNDPTVRDSGGVELQELQSFHVDQVTEWIDGFHDGDLTAGHFVSESLAVGAHTAEGYKAWLSGVSKTWRGSMFPSERQLAGAIMRRAQGTAPMVGQVSRALGPIGAAASGYFTYEEHVAEGMDASEAGARGIGSGAGGFIGGALGVAGCGALGLATGGVGGIVCFGLVLGASYVGSQAGDAAGGGIYGIIPQV